jgi:D-amino-acid dehydrogenase
MAEQATVVLGAGVIGVTTAYYLAKSGRKVVVIDRQDEVARETSFANAGLIAPGHAYTWASPRAPAILAKSLVLPGQALRLKLNADPRMWLWCWQFLRNCTQARSTRNTQRKVRLCMYSQERLQALAAGENIDYQQARKGLLYVYRNEASLQRGARNAQVLRAEGLQIQVVDAQQLMALEPVLRHSQAPLAGGLYCPSDESGDSHLFTRSLAARCLAMGVEFRMNTRIDRIESAGDAVSCVHTDKGVVHGRDFVLALGAFSPALVRDMDYRLPVYPVKGYSMTLPVRRGQSAPLIGGVDEDSLTAWATFGDRMRLTATAEFSGFDVSHRPRDFQHMLATAQTLFPDAADYAAPSYWACLRPMTPEGTPILGRTRHRNLFLNVGHGHMGWTMACGSSAALADIMRGAKPGIGLEGMTLQEG